MTTKHDSEATVAVNIEELRNSKDAVSHEFLSALVCPRLPSSVLFLFLVLFPSRSACPLWPAAPAGALPYASHINRAFASSQTSSVALSEL
jgi:hypothetical protein